MTAQRKGASSKRTTPDQGGRGGKNAQAPVGGAPVTPARIAAEGGFQAEGKAVAMGGLPRDVASEMAPAAAPNTEQLFDAANVELQRRMRFNPLRMLDPERLSMALDNFEIGILRDAALLWDAMVKRDDTLITVKNHLEESVASKDWGVFKKPGLSKAQEKEAARHQACLEYFYDNLTATDAFDRNERGGRPRVIKHMMRADSFYYATGHIVWKPEPGKTIEVDEAEAVPVISAEVEYVPLWYFENVTGTLRFLPFGGFGITGQEMDWNGEWMVTVGRGVMFAACICYMFKRLTFQDWTIYNERYAQNKVVGQTSGSQESAQGQALLSVIREFNSDQGIAFFDQTVTDKPPISLMGPTGTTSVELFKLFIDRQDSKMTVMYRGSDLSMMSKGGAGEKPIGASLQGDETEKMETSCCRMIQSTCNYYLDRHVIRYCFGEGVQPLAYFGLPDMDREDTAEIRESAGFLADRGVKVKAEAVADRLGIELAAETEEALQSIETAAVAADPNAPSQAAGAVVKTGIRADFSANAAPAATAAFDAACAALEDFIATTANANPNHDGKGRFAAAPARISVEEADALLTKGFSETNPDGKEVRFGKRAKQYLEKKPDGAQRKSFLNWARETVKTESPVEIGDREIYQKTFDQQGKAKGFTVLVSTKEGEVWDWYRKPAGKGAGE